jgi:FtsH-binding integral membrane protein
MESASLVTKLQSGVVSKTAPLLTVGLAISAVGSYLGAGITGTAAIITLLIAFFAGCFLVPLAVRLNRVAGIVAVSTWCFVAGLFFGPALKQYTEVLGPDVVLQCYMGTAAVMLGTWVVTLFSKFNFGKLGGVLTLALFGLILVGIVNIFVTMSGVVNTVYSLIGMVVFVGFFLYDFHRAKSLDNTWTNAVDMTMALFLNFYNFLFFFLRLRSGDR